MSNFQFAKKISFDSKTISETDKPFLIAELGLNHNNNFNLAKEMICAAKDSGADAVKLQSYHTEEFINKEAPNVTFLFDIFKKYELDQQMTFELYQYAQKQGIILFSTPLTLRWVSLLNEMGVSLFKVASGDLENYPLIDKICTFNKPLILSTGASLFNSVEETIKRFINKNYKDVILMHCVSLYPTPENKINLARMLFLKNKFNTIVGFSDHTQGTDAAAYAVLMGASVIEKHFTLDRNLEGPDHILSATPNDLSIIREKIDNTFCMRQDLNRSTYYDSWPEEFKGDYFGKRSMYSFDNQMLPMRPKQDHLPLPKNYDIL